MKTKNYESVLIINASLEDNQIAETVNRVRDYIITNGGKIDETEEWGRKRLAYPIQKSKSGYYLILRFTASVDFVSKLERIFRLDETIIRYLTVSLDSKALEYYQKMKEKVAEETDSSSQAEAAEVVEKEISDSKD